VARVGVQVADALEYAHKQGVLHRDIKPSNLLLDLRGTVWVTDFGLAKAEGGENLTHTGDIIGTLRYMPPEAFDGRADARGDVYSLGLTLYELAALRPAFDERDRNRLIKQVTTQEPEPVGRLRRGLPRDLETIIHKAIDRDPARRYRTAGDLGADLQRFVDDEPIQARRQTVVERYVRWARHHPGIAVLGAVLTAVLVLTAAASLLVAGHMTRLAAQEAKAADDERAARREAEEAQGREAGERKHAEQAKQAADESRAQAVKALQKAEENYARARAAVNDYLTAVSDDDRLKEPGLSPLRAQLLQSALGFYQDFLKERSDDPALRKELAAVYFKVGQIYSDLGQRRPASQSFAQAQRLYEALAGDVPDDPEVQDGLAKALFKRGQNERAIVIWEKLLRPDNPRYLYDLGWACSEAARSYGEAPSSAKKDPAKQLEFLRKALAARERLVKLRPDDPEARQGLAASLNNIAVALTKDHPSEQLPLYRRAAQEMEVAYKLRPNDPLTVRGVVVTVRNVASVAMALGHADEAVAAYRRVVEVLDRRARDNPDVPGNATDMVTGYGQLAAYLRELGRLDEAARVAERGRERIAEAREETTEFFLQASSFEFAALAVAEARAKSAPDGETARERAAATAVTGLRRRAFFGWWDANWMRTNPATELLRDRADFQDLLARAEELGRAGAVVGNASATPADKLVARRAILTTLEALAGPPPTARYVRRSLAEAHQFLGEAYLGVGRADEAKAAFDEALAIRQKLVEEAPKDEQLRADLAVSQTAVGDLLANAGRLADAAKTWEAGLATLEAALKANPNSIPFQTALLERQLHVANQYAYTSFGLWDEAARHYRRAFEIQTPTQFVHWHHFAVVLAEIGDTEGVRKLAERAATIRSKPSGEEEIALTTTVLLTPSADARWSAAVKELATNFRYPAYVLSERLFRGIAYLRLGEGNEALPLLADNPYPWEKWPAVALAEHLLGHPDAACEALRQADLAFDRLLRDGVSGGSLGLPVYWEAWLRVRALRREAYRAIHGKPPPDSPYERLHQGRLLVALDRPQEAEAEFAAAVALRPDDPGVWQTRARLFVKLGRMEQAAADLVHAQTLKTADPKSWVETGRVLAEMGEHDKADAAFTRAAALSGGELNRFLEAGWWAAGPYPEQIDLPCPPEVNPDPSKPVAAVGRVGDLKWQTVSIDSPSGEIKLGPVSAGARNATFYSLAYVYADRDRTASLYVRTATDMRLWVNGSLVLDGFGAWNLQGDADNWVPIALRAGRNQLLVKTRTSNPWCECQFRDAPGRRVQGGMALGLWAEAADLWAEADRRGPLEPWRALHRIRCLLAVGRNDEARRVFAEVVLRHERTANEEELSHLAMACPLPPEKGADRDRWVDVLQKFVDKDPNTGWRHFWLGYAYSRAGRFDEAEKSIRRAIALGDQLYYQPLLASTLHHVGRADDARKVLEAAEEQYARLVKRALAANPYHTAISPGEEVIFRATLPEARVLVRGKDSGPSADEAALLAKARERYAELEKADDFARLTDMYPDQPRLWIDRARHLGRLGRWDEAGKSFAKAVELAPKSPQVWKERGRAHAELGKWGEAAADLSKALDLTPEPKPNFPYHPWGAGRDGIDDLAARWDEVFDRVAKLRPKDVALWARRVEHSAEAGQWAEAEATLKQVVERFPDDWWAPTLLAKLLLRRGDVAGYTEVSKRALDRFTGTTDDRAAVNLVRTALLAPANLHESPQFQRLLGTVTGGPTRHFWMQITPVLADYRRGDAVAAVRRLTTEVKPDAGIITLEAFTDAVRALAYQKAGQHAEARDALARARTALERHRPRPDRGWAYDWNWPNWVEVEILVREAESLIPNAPAAVAQGAAPAQEQAARRERKGRADRLSTAFALALIRLDVGSKAEAEAELRKVVAERVKLAAEEPDNPEYAGQVADTRLALGRLLTDAGRPDEGLAEARQAVAIRDKLAAEPSKTAQAREELALTHFAIGDVAWKSGRLADGYGSWQKGLALLEQSAPDRPGGAGSGVRLRQRRQAAAQALTKVGLWREAAPFWAFPGKGEPVEPYDLPWLQLLAGDAAGYRHTCQELVRHLGTSGSVHDRCFVAWAGTLADRSGLDPRQAVSWAEEAAADYPPWQHHVLGLSLYRAGRFQQAIQALQASLQAGGHAEIMSWPVLAMAHHRLGHAAEARRWLDKASTEWLRLFPVTRGGDGLTLVPAQQHDAWDGYFHDCMTVEILLREATLLITGAPSVTEAYCRVHAGRVYLRLGERDKAEAEFRAAGKARPDDPALWLARSRAYAAAGQPEKAAADFARARAVAEKALARRPGDADAAGRLADVLLEKMPLDWKVVKPVRLTSDGGATLTVQPDGSILASGTSPDRDVYTVEAEVEGPVSAVRLEALADDRLPNKGPGRRQNGNFHLNDVQVTVTPGGALAWSRAFADYEQTNGYWVRNAIDADPNTAWGISPKMGEPHWAVFVARKPIGGAGRVRITVRLDSGDKTWVRTTLGRFRLSVTATPAARVIAEDPPAAPTATENSPWTRLGVALAVSGADRGRAAAAFAQGIRVAESGEQARQLYQSALDASVTFDELAKARPDDARLWITHGRARAEAGDARGADAAFTMAAKLIAKKVLGVGWWAIGP
jgi:tetratricopeptide (TPR) repeat protein